MIKSAVLGLAVQEYARVLGIENLGVHTKFEELRVWFPADVPPARREDIERFLRDSVKELNDPRSQVHLDIREDGKR